MAAEPGEYRPEPDPSTAPGVPSSGMTFAAPNQHVAYRGNDGHVYELLW